MDRLKGENEALIRRLGELEERVKESGGGLEMGGEQGTGKGGGELVPRESWEQVCKEKEELVEEVRQKEKRLLRLQQVFTSKSAEFREAIASILGLKLAFYPNGQVRVTSMYDLNASFIFQPTSGQQGADSSGMKMQLVAQGEGGPQDLPNLMHYWIENEQCPPGFLASVTLECYDNWKRSQQEEGEV
jgi:mitotic spindle assembly checkpoint protein MAD1